MEDQMNVKRKIKLKKKIKWMPALKKKIKWVSIMKKVDQMDVNFEEEYQMDVNFEEQTYTYISSCISSVLSTVHWNDVACGVESYQELNRNLRLLQTFVLCGKKLSSDSSFIDFLTWIQNRLWDLEKSQICYNASDASLVENNLCQFTFSLKEEMVERYEFMLEFIGTSHEASLMTNEILDIIASILDMITTLEHTLDFFKTMHPLKIQLVFLKSLIHFVTKGNTEARVELLAHSETIAINTACVLFHGLYHQPNTSSSHNPSEVLEEMLSGISTLVQKMKPIDPRVYEIYTQSLSGSKLSKQLLDDNALLTVENFLDSLLSILADIISLETCLMKDQLQEVYKSLVSFNIILRQLKIGDFDMKIQKEIADVVTDAGISICSFYQPQMYVNFEHQHLLDKFEMILLEIAESDQQIQIVNYPRTSSYGFVDCILENLMDLLRFEAETTTKSRIETIQVELASMRFTLRKLSDEHVEVQTQWNRLLEVAVKVERVIDYQEIYPLSNSFSISFDSIVEYIGNIKADVLKIEVKETRGRTYSQPPVPTTPSTPNKVIGFEDEEREVLDRLRGGSQHLRLIGIVGMPGAGKTTLGSKVYNHCSLSYCFLAKAWCTISQVLGKKKVLIDLLKQICPDAPSKESECELDLADKLRRNLKGKRYLIFLDDIWTTEEWNVLKDSFPDDNKGSRIIFTSRSLDIAPREILDQEPLILSPLNEKDSLKLLYTKLIPREEYGLPPADGFARQIVARCGGLPLAIIIVASTLASVDAEAWDGIMGSFNFLSCEDNCRSTLEFSYGHLHDYLRPCFLYFGVFPEDEEVSVRMLLRMWIAEGFVRKFETCRLEDVAESYLNMLIDRSLITSAKRRSDGRVKTCRIHDLLHEFCIEKAKDERFFHFAKGSDELYSFKEPPNLRRLLIDCDTETLRKSKVYSPHGRSLVLRGSRKVCEGMSPTLQFSKLLKVLNLEQIFIGDEFPCTIQQLVLLTFLAIRGGSSNVPSWLANLSNLETLIIHTYWNKLSLPDNLWNMQKLKYLYLQDAHNLGTINGVLPMYNLDGSCTLYELDRLKGVVFDWVGIDKQLRKLPNIRKLKCLLSHGRIKGKHAGSFIFPDFSSKLESLDMCGELCCGVRLEVRFKFASLTNLKRLKLSDLHLYWEIFSVLGKELPNLEVLKLKELTFEGEEEYIWEMKNGEFSKLRILEMVIMPIWKWIACDDHEFECFQKLVLCNCYGLEELPSCLETIETLEVIEVTTCSMKTEVLVMQIEEAQRSWGNECLEVTVIDHSDWARSMMHF